MQHGRKGQQHRRIAAALRLIEARLGAGVVRRLTAARPRAGDRGIPSGSLGLDLATGLGGLPRGHLTELFGAETSGKTALLYAALAAAQRAGGLALILDAEGGADGEALRGCGVDLDALLVARPASLADALLMLTILARCRGLDLLALSSIAALRDLPLDGRPEPGARWAWREQGRHDLARVLARGLRVLNAALTDGPTAVVATNTLPPPPWGDRTPGGRALHHFAALRIAVRAGERLPDAAGGTGALRVDLTVVKHKLGAPGGVASVEILAGGGIDHAAELLAIGRRLGLVACGAAGLTFAGRHLGGDERSARRWLGRDRALAGMLREAILAAGRPAGAA